MNQIELGKTLDAYLARHPHEADDQNVLKRLLNDGSDVFSRKNMKGHITSSALVLNHARDSILFIHHKATNFWMQPGGHYEAPGTLWDSAQREVLEETTVDSLQLHEWHNGTLTPFDLHTHDIAARPEKNETWHYHHDFLYLAVAPENAVLSPQVEEVRGVRWIPLGELDNMPGLRLHQRFLPKLKRVGLI